MGGRLLRTVKVSIHSAVLVAAREFVHDDRDYVYADEVDQACDAVSCSVGCSDGAGRKERAG
eukprot:2596752-Lingulodinium_polyedra.AAC.1